MFRITVIPRVVDAGITRLARGAKESTTGLADANTGAVSTAVRRVARVAWVIDARLAHLGALLAGEATAGGKSRGAFVDGGGDRGTIEEDADAAAVSTTIVGVAVVPRVVDAGLAFLGALEVGDAAAEGSGFQAQAGAVRFGIAAGLRRVGEALLAIGAGS